MTETVITTEFVIFIPRDVVSVTMSRSRDGLETNLGNVSVKHSQLRISLTLPRDGTHDFFIQSRTLYYHDTPPPMVAARGCLPCAVNVCAAVPTNQISSAIGIFHDFGHRGCELTFELPSSSPPHFPLPSTLPLFTPTPPSVKSWPLKSN